MAQIVSLISGKGGTGKTSLCAGIAACLARDGFRVLAIDLDVGLRNLDIALGMADEAALPFTAVMRGETPVEQATPHPTQARLSLLTAPVTERIDTIGLRPFGAMLRQAKGKFDWILLDAPAGLGRGFQLAWAYADEAHKKHPSKFAAHFKIPGAELQSVRADQVAEVDAALDVRGQVKPERRFFARSEKVMQEPQPVGAGDRVCSGIQPSKAGGQVCIDAPEICACLLDLP